MWFYANWVTIGSENGFLLIRCQAIAWTNSDLLIRCIETQVSEFCITMWNFSFEKKTAWENVDQLFRRQQSGIVGGRWLWWNYHQLKDSKYIHLTVYMIIGPYKGICRHCSNNVSDIKIYNKWQREWHTTFWFFVLLICHVRNTNVQDSSVLHILSAETYHMAIFWHTNIKDFQWWLK